MLNLLLFFCFRLHTKIKPKVLPTPLVTREYGCENQNKVSSSGWLNLDGNTDSLFKCDNQKIIMSGTGLFQVRMRNLNFVPNGIIHIKDSDFECSYGKIYQCGAFSKKSQIIRFEGIGKHSISGTNFEFCGLYPFHYIEQYGKMPDEWDPSLIYIDGNSSNIFSKVSFHHPLELKTGFYETFPTRPIRIEEDCSLSLTECYFYNSTCYTNGSFLQLGSTVDITIKSCTFQECYSPEKKAHAIWITENSRGTVTIDNCKFTDCGRDKTGYVIHSEVSGLIFKNNIMTFSSLDRNCGCIRCSGKGKYSFENNQFSNAQYSGNRYFGVAIFYEGINRDGLFTDEENLTFNGNTFDNIVGNNFGRCLSANILDGGFTVLSNNIVQNCPSGGFFVKIMHRSVISSFEVSNWHFINNIVNDKHGGGSGIWVENYIYDGKYTAPYILKIKDCEFRDNYCGDKGGGFQIGDNADGDDEDKYVTRVEVQITGCKFINNTAALGGGAIAIQTNFPLLISNCQFIDNKSPVNGGAIYIQTEVVDPKGEGQQMPNATIEYCQFQGNSGKEAHCIYIKDAPLTPIDINHCQFNNNYDKNYAGGSCILSNSIELTVTSCNFTNDDLSKSSGGINVTSRSTLIVSGSDFVHCTAGNIQGSYGGAIGYADLQTNKTRNEYIKITKCTFDGNGGSNGVSIALKPRTKPIISNLNIKNHILTNWIFFIHFQDETDGDVELTSITFDNNSFDNTKYAEYGGGTGIWIAEAEDLEYNNQFNLIFDHCDFLNNYSPENGGALSYGGSLRLQNVELTFKTCTFRNNKCEQYYGGACRFETNKPVNIYDCTFIGNRAEKISETGGSGGGAVFFGATVQSVVISGCTFENCFAYRGSFIFTNGALRDINISKCTFRDLESGQANSVYIEVDSAVTNFYFDSNKFDGLQCQGDDGGAGFHVINGADVEISRCQFISCIGKDKSGMIRIPDQNKGNSNSQLVFFLCEFNNEKGSGEDGARAVYVAKESFIRFDSCQFLTFVQENREGSVLYSSANSKTIFYNCSFVSLRCQSLINMNEAEIVEILDCLFDGCVSNSGSLITATSTTNFTVSNCKFTKDTNLINLGIEVVSGLVSNNTFDSCSSNNGAISISGGNKLLSCVIKDNIFSQCYNNQGCLALHVGQSESLDIYNCTFIDNYNDNEGESYSITTSSSRLNFYNCTIEYTQNKKGGGIQINSDCGAIITDIKFKNLHSPCGIYYNIDSTQESIISNCLFSGFVPIGNGQSGYSAFCFKSSLVSFFNNTIENQKLVSSNWNNLLTGEIPSRLENCTFYNNEISGTNAGGAGIHFSDTKVTITNCNFIENHANLTNRAPTTSGTGGALQFLSAQNDVLIENCSFANNKADFEGGALSLQSMMSTVFNSVFTDNQGGREDFGYNNVNDRKGGAIYYNLNGQHVLQQCTFKKNEARESGNAIYINGNAKVSILDECLFEDNVITEGGSQIMINGNGQLEYTNSTVRISNSIANSRGIELTNGKLHVFNSTFSNIEAKEQDGKIEGNAILVNQGNNEATIEDNLFKNCYRTRITSYSISFSGKALNFIRNVFDFSNNKGCGCLRIYSTGQQVVITDNLFMNSICPDYNFHGLFIYEEIYKMEGKSLISNNVFNNCNSVQTACFQFKWRTDDYIFIDNIFQNNNLDSYLGEFDFLGEKINGTFKLDSNKFINNTGRSGYGGGSGLWFQNKKGPNDIKIENHYTLTIDGCEFINNHAVYNRNDAARGQFPNGHGGAIQFGYTESVSNIDVVITNTTFSNNKADNEGGALSFQIIGYALIDNCVFEENEAGLKPSEIDRIYGGAIYYQPSFNYAKGHYSTSSAANWIYSDNLTIVNSKFIKNKATDATTIYSQYSTYTDLIITNTQFIDNYNNGHSNFSIISEAKEFIFESSKIEYGDAKVASAGIKTYGLTTIKDSHFIKNSINDALQAESLFVDEDCEEIEVYNSIFEDCGRNGPNYYSIKIYGQNANIHDNTFNYTSNAYANSGGSVSIKRCCYINFYNNFITSTFCVGAFSYTPDDEINKHLENVRIEKCTFENLNGTNGRALWVASYTNNVTFVNSTIQNCLQTSTKAKGGYLFVFAFKKTISEFTLDRIIFRKLTTSADYGGGCGGWVQLPQKRDRYTLIFSSCIFEENYAIYTKEINNCPNGQGGALQYGWTDSISNVNLRMENCKFIKNKADREGGALCLMIQGNVDISECEFTNNVAGYNGGAISITPSYGNVQNYGTTEAITIDGCTFKQNTGSDANAIYVNQGLQTDLIISRNCQFIDNTLNGSTLSVVLAETRNLQVDETSFIFNDLLTSCNAISTNSTNVDIDNVLFKKCVRNGVHGSALDLKEITKTCTILNCQFIDNGNNNKGCVIYSEASALIYSNNLIDFTNEDIGDRGLYIPNMCKFSVLDSTFHNCKWAMNSNQGASFSYEGIRKTSRVEELSIENTIFDNNKCQYASCFYMLPTTIPILKNITQRNHQTGNFGIVIIYQFNTKKDTILEKCTFENNCRTRSSQSLPDCGGCGLWIACANQSTGYMDSYKLIFNECKFIKNRNNYLGGAFAYGYSNTLRYIFVELNECTFENNTCDNERGGALSFNGMVPVTITNSLFKENKCNSEHYKGHCINIDKRCRATITECTFIDNGVYNENVESEIGKSLSGHSIIQCSGNQLDVINCNMTFTDADVINSRFIDIDYCSIVNLVNTSFSNCNVGNLWGGAIHLNKASLTSIIDEQITIDSCVFDNNTAANGCAALLNASSIPHLNNMTFRNVKDGKYLFAIFFIAFRDYCSVENTVFENCTSPVGEDGGGSAIWIANNKEISQGRPFELMFKNCIWRNNKAEQRGGAFHYGTSATLTGVQMTFDHCTFDGNHAKEEGGAVSLLTRSPIVFSNCIFKNNYVENSLHYTKGGSISINSKTPLVSISGCSFTNETSDEGNSIFIHSIVQACLISGCTFKNCGKKGTNIISETMELMLINSEILFDRRIQSSRGLEIRTISVTTISSCTFRNCHCDDVGGGIYLNNTLLSEEQEDLTIEDTIFDACESDLDGCAFYLNASSAPVLRKVTFQNQRFDKNVSVILNNVDFQDVYTLDGCIFNNNLYQNTLEQDGGGSGIFIANNDLNDNTLYKLSFVGCTWTRNTAAYGGAFSTGNHKYHRDTEIVFERCTFRDNIASNNKGGALYLKTSQFVLLDECNFANNRCHNPDSPNAKYGGAIYIVECQLLTISHTTFTENYGTDGNAIWVEEIPLTDITDCTFTSNNNGRLGSQICSKSEQLNIKDSYIQFNENKAQSRGIHIFRKCQTLFSNCQFLNCNLTSENGGAIYITNDDPSLNRTESLSLVECLFEKCDSSNGCVIQGSISCNPTIQKCTISKCNGGHYIISIFFSTIQQFVTVSGCTFIDNYFAGTSTSDAGGSGIWIAHERGMSVESMSLAFEDCHFITNTCGKNGGAFAYGESPTLKNITLQFNKCIFNGNIANGGLGGALYISTDQQLTITQCSFADNKCNGANTKGSACYINSPSVHIRETTFNNGQAIDGCALYTTSSATNLAISDSKFNNCTLYSESLSLTFHSSTISFYNDSLSDKYRGAHIKNCNHLVLSESNFINCKCSSFGGGVNIESALEDASFTFSSCRFINNKANSQGGGLYLSTSASVSMNNCYFDGNEALEGSAFYIDAKSKLQIEVTQVVRNKETQNAAAFIKNKDTLTLNNLTFVDNAVTSDSCNSLYLLNEGTASIENCNFDIKRSSSNQYAIKLIGESQTATVTFTKNCFIHQGDEKGSPVYISSSHKGPINLPEGNCFDLSETESILNSGGGSINKGSNAIFDCHNCGEIYIPTLAPESTPSQSPTPSQIPSSDPHTSTPQTSQQTSAPRTDEPTSSQPDGSGSSSTSKKKSNSKMIAMIAGISAAIVVLIIVIIILLWLFIFRKRPTKDKDSDVNASEMNDEKITEISVNDTGADDPIWAGTNEDNPLFNGGDDDGGEGDDMIHNDFEESWSVI